MRLRTLVFLAISLAALVGGLWYWRKAEQTAARRAEAWDEQQRIDATEAVLDRQFEWPPRTLPLADFAEAVADISGLAVDLNTGAIAAEHEPVADIRISIPGGTLSAGAVLRLGLSPHDLCFDIDDQRLVITTPDASRDRTRMKSVVYPLPQPLGAPKHEEEWQELVSTSIEPSDWDEVGGRGHIEPVPGGLVVTHTPDVQRQVRRLLAALAKLDEDSSEPLALNVAGTTGLSDRERILAALDKPASLDCQALPLDELFRDLSINYEIPIYLDTVRMANAGTYVNHPLTRRIPETTLRSLLENLCEYLDLDYSIRDGALVIAPEDTVELNSHVAYPVRDLVMQHGQADFDGLIDLITTCVAADHWSDVGGPGSVNAWGDHWLLVSQDEATQQQVAALLSQVRRALGTNEQNAVFPVARPSAADIRVEAALDRLLQLHWVQTPFTTVREDLEAKLDVPVALHGQRLEAAGVSLSTTVTCDLPTLPAHQALDQLLEQFSLDYLVRDGQVLITTRDYAERTQPARLYDVRPLIDSDLGMMTDTALTQLLHDVIDMESWDEAGGPGSIMTYRGLLVVSQSEQNHRQVASFLGALEKHCLRQPSIGGDSPWIVRSARNPAEEHIERLLATPTSVNFCGEPLPAAISRLADAHELPLIFQDACKESLAEYSRVFTLSCNHMTMGAVLDRIVQHDSQTEYYVLGDSLLVAFRDLERRDTRLYRVDDLLQRGTTLPDDLIANLDPGYVDNIDQICTARVLSSGWLVVAAQRRVHAQVEDWLSALRNGKPTQRAMDRAEVANEKAAIEKFRGDPFAPNVRNAVEGSEQPVETNP